MKTISTHGQSLTTGILLTVAARGLLLKTVHHGFPWETFAGKFTEVKEQLVSNKHSGRERYSTKFLQGGVRPEVQTVNQPPIYHFFFFIKMNPFHRACCLFHIPTVRSHRPQKGLQNYPLPKWSTRNFRPPKGLRTTSSL